MVSALPSVTDPEEVLLSVKLLIVVLPDSERVPKFPVPPITMFELVVATSELELGVNVPFIVNVFDPMERFPLSRMIVPTITRLA